MTYDHRNTSTRRALQGAVRVGLWRRLPHALWGLALLLGCWACNNTGRTSPAELQRKIDSVVALEKARQLRLQGIGVEGSNPMQAFYDSLDIQPLPLVYSEEYVALCPNFRPVGTAFATVMGFEGRLNPRAISLPETAATRLLLLAADEGDDRHSLWLYSLGADFFPVDKLQLYDGKLAAPSLRDDEQRSLFSITSDYEIMVTTYATNHSKQLVTIYGLDETRHFFKARVLETKR